MKSFILLFLFGLLNFQTAMAYDFNKAIREKQQAKEAKRWSLSQWLEQKSKVKLMDMWLGYNQPSPYEFFFSVDTSNIEQQNQIGTTPATTQNFKNYRGSFGAFVTAVGLYGEYEQSDEELTQWKALFMVRLLGHSDQSTNLTLHYGLMNQDMNNDPIQFQVGGGRMNLYIIKAFALTGLYDYIFESTSEQNFIMQGQRFEAGAFIEYGALRIYGSFYQETMNITSPALQEFIRTREGILYGLRFYF